MFTNHLRRALLLGACVLAAAACDTPSGSRPPRAGMTIVGGAGLTDSIGAQPAQTLTVRLLGDDGKPAVGVPVQFTSLILAPAGVPPVVLVRQGAEAFSQMATVNTGADGQASVSLRFGVAAGPAGVEVAGGGFRDTATYTIAPGAAASVTVSPGDSALYAGRSYALRTAVYDRAGNPRTDAVTLEVLDGPVTVGGGSVAGSAIGRGRVLARSGAVVDTAYVSVVPQGTVAGYTTGNEGLALYTVQLDGSELVMRVQSQVGASGYVGEMPAAWSADGSSLIYHDNLATHRRELYRLDLATGVRTRLLAPGALLSEAWPQRSADGAWIWFNGQTEVISGGGTWIYRVRPDGTGLERVPGGLPASFPREGYASPSPDGTRLAFLSDRTNLEGGLEITNLATGQATPLHGKALSPRWSPDGEWIAFIDPDFSGTLHHNSVIGAGALSIIRPDGTGLRKVNAGTLRFQPGVDWSPDGRFLVGLNSDGVLTVVEVATGLELPIHLGTRLRAPAWKR